MNLQEHIKKLLRENLFNEEYINNTLIGYHVTSKDNWESIKNTGLKIGTRKMQGKGLYAFYDYNNAIRYATKDNFKNTIIVKFEITEPNRFIILNMDIAKQVFGPNDYHLINQIENYFSGGLKLFYNDYVKLTNPNMSFDTLKEKLNEIEINNEEGMQRIFLFNLIPMWFNDKLNIIWDGNYGLEYRINNTNLIKILGYKNISDDSEINISILDKIPQTNEFLPLIEFLNNYKHLDTITKAYNFINDKSDNVRNNRDYDYYDNLLKLIDKLN